MRRLRAVMAAVCRLVSCWFDESVALQSHEVLCTCVQVWRPHMASQHNRTSVLVVDIHRGHLTDEFMGSLTSMSTEVVYIPSGCCCRLQPLDVCVTPVLRDFLQVGSPVSPVASWLTSEAAVFSDLHLLVF